MNKEEKENVLLVLNEFSEEYKVNNKVLSQLVALLKENNIRLTGYMEKMKNNPQEQVTIAQIQSIESQLEEIQQRLSLLSQLKQEKRILLFPEENAKEYYSSIFRWVLYIVIATYGFLLLRYVVEVVR